MIATNKSVNISEQGSQVHFMFEFVAILGLLPASMATGLGSDVQRPLATVIVWGLFSSTALTLCVLPVLYVMFPPRISPLAASEPATDGPFVAVETY